MPNYCEYEMKIVGSEENCRKWHKRMRDYEEPHHFWRIFDSTIIDEGEVDDEYYMVITGDCAWSIETCCRSSGYAHCDLFEVNTEELSIAMEVYSSEPGIGFQEHYLYENGECLISESTDYSEYWLDDMSLEELKAEYNLPASLTESDFVEGRYCEGGYIWEFEI